MRTFFVTHLHPKCLKGFYTLFLSLLVINVHHAIAQTSFPAPVILSSAKAAALITDNVRQEFKMSYPIYRVYQYADQSGQYYCVLTESRNTVTEHDTINQRIKAVNLKMVDGKFTKTWELNDNFTPEVNEESSIWFWTKYVEFLDYDHDGLVDPIIIYGTRGSNGYDDGRAKILIYYRGQKVAIRHQNGVLDDERSTQVDAAFYNLPASIQAAVRQKMEQMVKNQHAIFPNGWQTAMRNKKTAFDEAQ
ncbi:hypothetical protein F0L74_21705 [Chitinophaga agrisoli]|uniref:Uncharacterized protein n=1 Tax=Chitinophaga agrisoli TaxID=2607653 RepID=A0A5B2VGY3_9BACT|nr:hypothetical protein [Chitinophaga agrisoli]KAA2238833.1 hypothetical protein F0L74_21705 [Chitinophaga agrisoli]